MAEKDKGPLKDCAAEDSTETVSEPLEGRSFGEARHFLFGGNEDAAEANP